MCSGVPKSAVIAGPAGNSLNTVAVCLRRFWPTMRHESFFERHPELKALPIRLCGNAESADVCIYSVFGSEALPEGAVRVFYTAENVVPEAQVMRFPEETFDFALSFARNTLVPCVHKRLPNYAVACHHLGYTLGCLTKPKPNDKRSRFCAFVQGNPVGNREEFVKHLMRYKRVDCPGRSLRNMQETVLREDTIRFLRNYKFAVCFENACGNGYVTEKIANAYMAGCVPIYWGDPLVVEDFNPGSFINANAFKTIEELVRFVSVVDRNDHIYDAFRQCPPFYGNAVPTGLQASSLVSFWENVLQTAQSRCKSPR